MNWFPVIFLSTIALIFVGAFIAIALDERREKEMSKTWGVWIPSLERWLEDEYGVPYVTNLKRDATTVIRNECVHPKQYEVRQYDPSIGRV